MQQQGRNLDIPTLRQFVPLLAPRRFKGARGGRAGAKSHFFGERAIEDMFAEHNRFACLREVQNSIKDSVKQLLEDKINRFGLQSEFKITEREIVCPATESLAIFRGLQNHTATSIKSLEGFNRVWYEEAQSLSKRSLEIAVPTFRVAGSEQWFSWNPDQETDPVDKFFADNVETFNTPAGAFGRRNRGEGDPDFVCVHVNHDQNPWMSDDMRRDMERDRQRDPDKYGHIWLGGYRKNSEARVLRNWRVERFDRPAANVPLYGGGDWGFSVDPTVMLLMFIVGRTLYIWREVWAIGCEIDRTPALFDKIDPDWTPAKAKDPTWRSLARRVPIVADSARPETIAYMQSHGFPMMKPAIKGAGSVEDGVEFLKSYDIVVHPDCVHTIDELTLYSYVIDKKTGEVTTVLEDKKNHTIDSARYGLENVRRASNASHEELRL
jgi:phage terminase large subunit